MRFEGGFQGRCNKLVDGCYSFWQAGLLPLLHRALFKEGRVVFTTVWIAFDHYLLIPGHTFPVTTVTNLRFYHLSSFTEQESPS